MKAPLIRIMGTKEDPSVLARGCGRKAGIIVSSATVGLVARNEPQRGQSGFEG